MIDPLSPDERSVRMQKVHSSGNKSTELLVAAKLISFGFDGWERQPKGILGKPDFYFSKYQLVIFVDGCFWHGCKVCNRRIPEHNRLFWQNKIEGNRKRDNRQRKKLRRQGYHVMRIWEHDLRKNRWIQRLIIMIRRIEQSK